MRKQRLGCIDVELTSESSAADTILDAAVKGEPFLVMTPNIQHVALLESDQRFKAAYARAKLVLPDGWPVAMLTSVLAGERARRVSGADLMPRLLGLSVLRRLRVGVIGGAPGAEAVTRQALLSGYPGMRLDCYEAPPYGFEQNPEKIQELLARRQCVPVDVLFLCLGTPKQEILAAEREAELNATVIVCLGAALDFLTGAQRRAPHWMQRLGLEWGFRVIRHPRRLSGRYVRAVPAFIRVVAREVSRPGGPVARER